MIKKLFAASLAAFHLAAATVSVHVHAGVVKDEVREERREDNRKERRSDRRDSGGGYSKNSKTTLPADKNRKTVVKGGDTNIIKRGDTNIVVSQKNTNVVVAPRRKPTKVVVAPKRRSVNNVVVVRNYGHSYYGFGHYHDDNDAWKWLAFTAITLKILDNLNEAQQRAYEDAQIKATTAPVGEKIIWEDEGATGYVVATKEGKSSDTGLVCREFQQSVTIGGETEEAWGNACLQEDGSWKIVDN